MGCVRSTASMPADEWQAMNVSDRRLVPGARDLLFLPLGGSGEIGMNLNLYGHDGHWLMVDLGITFGGETMPGIEVMTPDPAFIVERRGRLAGLVLTHAHEDHLGAVPYLWPSLRCPIYATPFTVAFLKRKLRETHFYDQVEIHEVALGSRFRVGPFDVELVTLTHSIPEPNALAIRTGAGTVLHTGDWKIDPEPLIGAVTDEARLKAIGDEGVLALVGDSTNALVEGESGSEATVRDELVRLFGECRQRIIISCFASNIARLQSIVHAAMKSRRHVALVGRSLWRMLESAREAGYLLGLPDFLTEDEIARVPRDRIVVICTGSQGEARAALPRIAAGGFRSIRLAPGDTVVFSSRVIPGNEKAILALQNRLSQLGLEIVTAAERPIHVSGHPARGELARMYQWVRPGLAVPVHGENRHLAAHAHLAESCQVPATRIVSNGDLLRLAPGPAETIAKVQAGRLAVDGPRLLPLDSPVIRERRRAGFNGSLLASLVLDRRGRLMAEPQVTAPGLIDPEAPEGDDLLAEAVSELETAVRGLGRGASDDDRVRDAARAALRRVVRNRLGKKPVAEVHLIRI